MHGRDEFPGVSWPPMLFVVMYVAFIPQIVSTLLWPIPTQSDRSFCCLIALSHLLPLLIASSHLLPHCPIGRLGNWFSNLCYRNFNLSMRSSCNNHTIT
jgi:hypothetical protein